MALTSINLNTSFDWSPHISSFIIRIPTSTHDIFTELVVQEIGSQLESVAHRNKDVAAIVNQVRSESTSDVYLYGDEPINDRYPKHTPDASFAHADSQYPSIIIETSYSQQHKVLERLADEYICGSEGNIAAILGLDIAYGVGSKKASLSIWRPRVVPDPDENEVVVLEMFSGQEADVNAFPTRSLSIRIFTQLNADSFCFGSHFVPTTGPPFKVKDCRFSSVTLRPRLASQVHLTTRRA